MRRRAGQFLIFLLAAQLPTIASAQARSAPDQSAGIRIGRSVLVSADAATSPHAESFLAMHPTDPARMLATSLVYNGGLSGSALYVTGDTGRTWQRARVDSAVPPIAGGDPIVGFSQRGAALFGGIQGRPNGFRVWRSSDGGLRWDGVTTVPGGIYDRQYLAVDRTSGRFSGRIYVAGAVVIRRTDGRRHPVIAVSSSTDDGVTFRPATFIDASSGGQHIQAGIGHLVVTRDGTLVIPFVSAAQLYVVVSNDGGATFSVARPGPKIGLGSGFRVHKTLTSRLTALDTSNGPFAGRLYVSWVDLAGDRYDVKVAYTDDLGVTWSRPTTVNDNVEAADPANAAIAVNRNGVVAVIFNDRRADPGSTCYRLYAAASLDGGDTFLPNVQINPNPTCPGALGNWPGLIHAYAWSEPDGSNPYHEIQLSGVPERFPNGGETQGLVAGPDGRFHAAWINGQSGVMQLWYTDFEVHGVAGRPRVDRTADLEIVPHKTAIDFAGKSLSFSIRLRNVSGDPIDGPLALVLDGFDAGLGGLVPANPDRTRSQRAPQWVFSLGGRVPLKPGEVSEVRELRWRFDGKVPAEPLQRFVGRFRIYQDASTNRGR